jgi:murein DD-endopeptidase MepM/ murein hydrolase activator NlpD
VELDRLDPRARSRRRRGAAWLLLYGLVVGAWPGHAEPRCLDTAQVCLDVREERTAISFFVSNQEAAPVSARVLVMERHNLAPRTPLPFRAVVAPGEEKLVGVLDIPEPAKGTRYALRWSAAAGDVLARHDASVRYHMPFGGKEPRLLSQGVGGSTSHRGRASHSYDFAMPWGTPVLAARGGRVVRVVDEHATGGLRRLLYDQANRVELLHDDGTLATYAHLRQGAVVQVGQQVSAGERIGFSGDTGYSSGPHLHFMVWKREPDLSWSSLPVRFDDGTPEGFQPEAGLAYAPTCGSTGAGCAPGALLPVAGVPARRDEPRAPVVRRDDGACVCPNGAVIHVELACELVCGR